MKKLIIFTIALAIFSMNQIKSAQPKQTTAGLSATQAATIKAGLNHLRNVLAEYADMTTAQLQKVDGKHVGCKLMATLLEGKANIFNLGISLLEKQIKPEIRKRVQRLLPVITGEISDLLQSEIGCPLPEEKVEE